jgi:nucleoside-diphosphate-sugar epimerase
MRIAVTGAAGFIGSHLCEHLLAAGHEVRGVDAFTRFYRRELKEANVAALRRAPGFALHELNLLDAPALAAPLAGADAICHLAGRPGVRQGGPAVYEAGNVRATEALVGAAARAGVRRVVLASSSSVYGAAAGPVREDAPLRPLSPYGRSKRRAERVAERLARRHGVELVTLRLFTVYGPRQRPDMAFARFTAAALAGEEMPLLGDGAQSRDFTFVADAAEAIALAVERGPPGSVLNVSGGRPARLDRALGLLAGALGREPRLRRSPADGREPRSTAADLGRVRSELGWEPRTGLAEGLRLQVAHAVAAAARAH